MQTHTQRPALESPLQELKAQDYLAMAESAASWIDQASYAHGQGTAWHTLPEAADGGDSEVLGSPNGFYNGAAGMILFYLTLHEASGKDEYLAKAVAAGEGILSTFDPEGPGMRIEGGTPYFLGDVRDSQWNMYAGVASLGNPLVQLSKATGDPRYRDFAIELGKQIIAAAHPLEGGIAWMEQTGLLFDGGIALYLLYLYHISGDEDFLEAGLKACHRIAESGSPDSRGGWHWQGMDPAFRAKSPDTYWPNFEFGTAGIGFLMARAYEESQDRYFLEFALEAAAHLRAIAVRKPGPAARPNLDSALVCFEEPGERDLFYLGNCHGAVGDAKFFYELYKVTGDKLHKEWVLKLYRGILAAGAPELHSPGYWHLQCRCCGTAGMLEFFLSLWAAFGDAEYLEQAKRAGRCLVSESFDLDGAGSRWYQAFTRLDPKTVDAYAGYETGAAGEAAALASLSEALAGPKHFHAWRYLYDPWPSLPNASCLQSV
jgi:lantibiotic modifying enzyme